MVNPLGYMGIKCEENSPLFSLLMGEEDGLEMPSLDESIEEPMDLTGEDQDHEGITPALVENTWRIAFSGLGVSIADFRTPGPV